MATARDLLEKHLADTNTSQSELARKAGLAPSAINKLLKGTRTTPDLATAMAIEDASGGAVPAKAWLEDSAPAETHEPDAA